MIRERGTMAEGPDIPPRPATPQPPVSEPPALARVPAPGSFTPRIKPLTPAGETAPVGASMTTPTPAPLPARGAPLFLLITLVAALLAVTFSILIALKL